MPRWLQDEFRDDSAESEYPIRFRNRQEHRPHRFAEDEMPRRNKRKRSKRHTEDYGRP